MARGNLDVPKDVAY